MTNFLEFFLLAFSPFFLNQSISKTNGPAHSKQLQNSRRRGVVPNKGGDVGRELPMLLGCPHTARGQGR